MLIIYSVSQIVRKWDYTRKLDALNGYPLEKGRGSVCPSLRPLSDRALGLSYVSSSILAVKYSGPIEMTVFIHAMIGNIPDLT